MSAIGDAVGGLFGGGDDAADAATDAANIQAQAQREALDYYKQQMELPTQVRDQALTQVEDIYFGEGGLDALKASPLYGLQMEGAEEASLRASSATGGLRSGAAISDVASVQNQAALNALSGIQGLGGIGTGAENIANMMSGIGQTQAQGITASAQAQQASNQAGFGNLMGLGQLGLGAASLFSDEALKENIEFTGVENGFPTFKWVWNDKAKKLGLSGAASGTLSKYVRALMPEAVTTKKGYDQVNYEMIGVSHGY